MRVTHFRRKSETQAGATTWRQALEKFILNDGMGKRGLRLCSKGPSASPQDDVSFSLQDDVSFSLQNDVSFSLQDHVDFDLSTHIEIVLEVSLFLLA